MSLQSLLVLFPGAVSLLCLLTFAFPKSGNAYFRKMKRFIALIAFFFLCAAFSFNLESKLMLHFVLLEQVSGLALIPCFLSFIKEYEQDASRGLFYRISCMLPMIHLVIGIESVYVAEFENSVRIYLESLTFNGPMFPYLANNGQIVFYACYTYMFKAFILFNFLLFALSMMKFTVSRYNLKDVVSFLLMDGECNPVAVLYFLSLVMFMIVVPVLILGKSCYNGKLMITVIASLVLVYVVFVISLVGAAGLAGKQTFKDILRTALKRPSRNK